VSNINLTSHLLLTYKENKCERKKDLEEKTNVRERRILKENKGSCGGC